MPANGSYSITWLAAKSCYDEWRGRKVSIGDEGKEGQRERESERERERERERMNE